MQYSLGWTVLYSVGKCTDYKNIPKSEKYISYIITASYLKQMVLMSHSETKVVMYRIPILLLIYIQCLLIFCILLSLDTVLCMVLALSSLYRIWVYKRGLKIQANGTSMQIGSL